MAVRKRGRRGARVSPRKNEPETPKMNGKIRPVESKDKKAQVVAQEIKIARLLANNDKKVRDKVLKRLSKWLTVRSQSSFVFTKADFMSLWKGLFYCMWMSDKMLIQEELAEFISRLVHCLNSKDTIVLYTGCALRTLATEWFGIDQYRLDKFSMLVRRILRQTFVVCKNQSWNMEWVTEMSRMFTQLFLHEKTGLGFNLHVTEIYMEELAKISNGDIPEDAVHELVKPFAEYLASTGDERQMKQIMRHVFRYLILQSNVGLDYADKFEAWRNAGFPSARIDDMEKIEMSDTEENSDSRDNEFPETETQSEIEKPLDPRAGRVDVELPQIPFSAAKIAELLSTYKFHPSSTATSRRQLLRLFNEFTELSRGRMPLGIKRVRKPNRQKGDMNPRKAALRLIRFEKGLLSDKMNIGQKEKWDGKAFYDQASTNNPKNGNTLGQESDASDQQNELTDTTATADLQDVVASAGLLKKRKATSRADLQDESAVPLKKRKATARADLQDVEASAVPLNKRKRNDSTCDKSSTKSQITENKKKLRIETSNKSKIAKVKSNQKSKTARADLQDVEASAVPLNKRKRSDSTCDKSSTKSQITDNKKKLRIEISKKSKTAKVKSNQKSKKSIADKNVECKAKKMVTRQVQTSNDRDQNTQTSPISNKKSLTKKLKGFNNKSAAKKESKSEGKIRHQDISLKKKKLPHQIKMQTNVDNSLTKKKKVMFELSRNASQRTFDYRQQVRKSPNIPFDANKKPLTSVLKMSPLPSLINPFYKKILK